MNKLLVILSILCYVGIYGLRAEEEECPCDGGTAPYQYDCDDDGKLDSCEPCDSSCGEDGVPSNPTKECCGNEEYDPNHSSTSTLGEIDISALADIWNETLNILGRAGPCDSTASSLPSVAIQVVTTQKCCDEKVEDLKSYGGAISWNAGGFECDWPFFGVPYMASVNLVMSGGLSVEFSVNKAETCEEDDDLCINGNVAFSMGGGLSGTAGGNVLRVAAVLEVATRADAEYCFEQNKASGTVCINQVSIVGTASLLSAVSKSFDYVIFDSECV